MLFSVYLTVLEDKSDEEQFIDAYNTYKRLVYHTAYPVISPEFPCEQNIPIISDFYTAAAKGGGLPQKGKPPPLLIIGRASRNPVCNLLHNLHKPYYLRSGR